MLLYRLLADLIVILHAGFVAFNVLGLLLVLAGLVFGWQWVRNFWFRSIHLLAMGFVGLEAVFGMICPLTEWENALRAHAGQEGYPGDFLGYWASQLLFFDAPQWMFNAAHMLFALLVLVTFILVPPRWPWRASGDAAAAGDNIQPVGPTSQPV